MSTKNPANAQKADHIRGLAPIIGQQPRVLVLGSMPSVASLEKQQYYGHPRNAFWPLMAALLGYQNPPVYARRVAQIIARGVAVWDVIGECERPGSLDSAIVSGSERINPVAGLVARQPSLQRIGLNGGLAATLFRRHCLPQIERQDIEIFPLPSTSPANARMNFADKCEAWRVLFD